MSDVTLTVEEISSTVKVTVVTNDGDHPLVQGLGEEWSGDGWEYIVRDLPVLRASETVGDNVKAMLPDGKGIEVKEARLYEARRTDEGNSPFVYVDAEHGFALLKKLLARLEGEAGVNGYAAEDYLHEAHALVSAAQQDVARGEEDG